MNVQGIRNVAGFEPVKMAQEISSNPDLNSNVGTDKSELRTAPGGAQTATVSNGSFNTTSLNDIYYDKKDLNKDGIVTYQEELEYALMHPGEETVSQVASSASKQESSTLYNNQGNVSVSKNEIQSVNIFL